MTFRDDREAALQRAEAAQQRAEALERELAEARGRITAMEDARPSRGRVVAVALFAVGFGAGTVGALSRAASSYARVRAAREAAAARLARAREAEAYGAAVNARIRRGRDALRDDHLRRMQVDPPPPRRAALAWRGVVDESADPSVRVGTSCVLEGDFVVVDSPTAERVAVRCGPQTLYETPAGTAPARAGLREGPIQDSAAHRYLLSLGDDTAAGAVPPWPAVSSLQHSAVVTRASGARVSIYLNDVSDPREGPALLPAQQPVRRPAFAADVARPLRVLRATGAAPVARGARCSFALRAVWEYPETCRAALRCGTTWLYGESEGGYLTCEVQRGAAVGALDPNPSSQGGDPRLEWRGDAVTVGDFGEAGAWEVVLGP